MLKGVLLISLALLCLASCGLMDKRTHRKKEESFKKDLQDSKETKRETICQPTCANPRGLDGCNCKNSNCMLKGCVRYGAFGAIWKPDNCTTCHCDGNKKWCFTETCDTLNCYGYPTIKRPGKCCEECDFGVARNECSLVPVGLENISLGDKDTAASMSCRRVLVHGCNRDMVWNNGKWYRCVAHKGKSPLSDNEGCEDVMGVYDNTVSCLPEELPENELPPDYDDSDFSTCAAYFP